MTNEQRNDIIHKIGEELAKSCVGFYGSVQFNIQDGKYVNANLNESIKPKK